MDFISLLRLLSPVLSAVATYEASQPSTPAYLKWLLNLAMQALGSTAAQVGVAMPHQAGMFGAHARLDLPPEDQWTPEGVAEFARSRTGE